MNHSGLIIEGFWQPRADHIEDAIRQINDTFHCLADLAPQWGKWWRSYTSVADRIPGPLWLVDQCELIRQELLDRRIKAPDGTFIDELGYHLSASSGPPLGTIWETSDLRLRCCSQTPPPAGFNSLAIDLPEPTVEPGLYDANLLAHAITVLVDVWDPDWMAVWDRSTIIVPPPWVGGPVLSWVNYLSRPSGVVVGDLPPRWRWFEKRGDKQVFIHEGGSPDPNKSNHIATFEQMASRIRWRTMP